MATWDPEANEVFLQALELLAPADRQAYLDEVCADNPDLRARVDGLISAASQAGSFLESSPVALAETLQQPVLEGPGTQIGPYKLMEKIGEGGMGVVYVAEQTGPVRRKVALKIIKPGMDSRQVIARFGAERQALALMDHANIARIFDAGAVGVPASAGAFAGVPASAGAFAGVPASAGASLDEDRLKPGLQHGLQPGRPYFVMELVRGMPITAFCDQARLDLRQRLALFITVCQAVQHAHQKGVIHRDLKPSNILVTLHDGVPVAKVIDFGVAKAIGQQLTEHTVYTAFAQLIGTPLYMSPEQAELSGLDIDTRSDIYSLGVLLYELLTGQTPFDRETIRNAGFDEMRRIIREDEPPRPSRRLSTLNAESMLTVSQQRGLDERRLHQTLRGELDWIVMKCLEKDRNRRYESASALAADVQAYLDDQPVQACPPSAAYRMHKLARRNRAILLTSGLVSAALLIGTGVSIWQAVKATAASRLADERFVNEQRASKKAAEEAANANAARQLADTRLENEKDARKEAAREAETARAVTNFLLADMLMQVDHPVQDEDGVTSRDLSVRDALQRAANKIEGQFNDKPLIAAAIQSAIGKAFCNLRDYPPAIPHLERARDLRLANLGPSHADTLHSLTDLASGYEWTGRVSDGMALRQELLEKRKAEHGPDDPGTITRAMDVAIGHRRSGNSQKALELTEWVVQQRRNTLGENHRDTLNAQAYLAVCHVDVGRFKEAVELYRPALDKLGASDIWLFNGYSVACQHLGRFDEADRILRTGVSMLRQRQDPRGRSLTAWGITRLARNYLLQHDYSSAKSYLQEALVLYESVEQEIRDSNYARNLAIATNMLGAALAGEGDYKAAESLLQIGYKGIEEHAQATNLAPSIPWQHEAIQYLVKFYEETQQTEEARSWREKLPASMLTEDRSE